MPNTKNGERGKSAGSVATQFIKGGPSPNRKGRPPGSKNRNALIIKILSELVVAEMGGKRRKISITEASLRRLSLLALGGDHRAILDVLRLWKDAEEGMQAAVETQYPFSGHDREVLTEVYERMKAAKLPTDA